MSDKLYKPWPVTKETILLDLLELTLERAMTGNGIAYVVNGHVTIDLNLALDLTKGTGLILNVFAIYDGERA